MLELAFRSTMVETIWEPMRMSMNVIISEPSNPWRPGAASLFTTDFFRIAKAACAGIFLQWLQLYELSSVNVHTLIRTFDHVFDHVLIFTPDPTSNDMLLLGSQVPLTVDRGRVARWMKDPRLKTETRAGRLFWP